MTSFSYTKSHSLTEKLGKVEDLRKQLLLVPLSLREKLLIRWNSTVDTLYYSLALANQEIGKKEIVALLTPKGSINLNKNQQELLRYKKAHDRIYQDWMAINKPLTSDYLITMHRWMYQSRIKIDEDALESNLRYIQANPDNPILQSALAQITIVGNEFFSRESSQMGHLISLIFLYKYGYDFRRMLTLDEYFFKQKDRLAQLINQSLRDPNITPYLEFVVEATEDGLTRLLAKISSKEYLIGEESTSFTLSDRQKDIITALDTPGSKISNKEVQKMFEISPITAARDLAKLTSFGLLFSIGKGRSTYYTKV